ncbi:haloalkane dehalogenase [Actinoallomurus sp. NPDC052308]|uniref:haloalkane dehalogenase n=1 Tax=Actinoallomurus sp. NPDC052308 TaxID=3155530 RepID=UPI0034237604
MTGTEARSGAAAHTSHPASTGAMTERSEGIDGTAPRVDSPTKEDAMAVLRTPEERFADLPGHPFAPHYVEIDAGDGAGTRLRVHYVDERPGDPATASGETVLLLHGEPSWSYLYRHVIPPLVAAGHRCVAPDLVGFGRSDKPADRFAYTYQRHVDWLTETVFDRLDLHGVTMVCHDWGGLLGLRLLAASPDRFRRVVATNTLFPTGDESLGDAYATWLQLSQRANPFEPGQVVDRGTVTELDPAVRAAYDAPFPDESYVQGARQFPLLVPIAPFDAAAPANRAAWAVLETLRTPFLCAFSDKDYGVGDGERMLRTRIPGAAGRAHPTITNAGHFVQEDRGPELAAVIDGFIGSTR